jgi:hypothetical protein
LNYAKSPGIHPRIKCDGIILWVLSHVNTLALTDKYYEVVVMNRKT